MERRRRIARLVAALAALSVLALGGATACGAPAGEGKNVPPSTSPK